MVSVFVDTQYVLIPGWVEDLASFRRWTEMDEFPEEGRIDFFQGTVWPDMSSEQLFSHVKVKTTFTRVLDTLAVSEKKGEYFCDGAYISNETAQFSVKPDGSFVLTTSFERGRVQLIEGSTGGFVELVGVPDMMLEIVSDSSVVKDLKEIEADLQGFSRYALAY